MLSKAPLAAVLNNVTWNNYLQLNTWPALWMMENLTLWRRFLDVDWSLVHVLYWVGRMVKSMWLNSNSALDLLAGAKRSVPYKKRIKPQNSSLIKKIPRKSAPDNNRNKHWLWIWKHCTYFIDPNIRPLPRVIYTEGLFPTLKPGWQRRSFQPGRPRWEWLQWLWGRGASTGRWIWASKTRYRHRSCKCPNIVTMHFNYHVCFHG